eukprot:TRINITY_DN3734_c0_g1_i3.p6 TRINITY_DN3734_c0_g1~~TRINITY_DN3734_c0_g1_i3.p6  ORF type:complete len:105 (+),score=0.52 TRINITY_DN3734_c0_g1_i3:939-1253(+)
MWMGAVIHHRLTAEIVRSSLVKWGWCMLTLESFALNARPYRCPVFFKIHRCSQKVVAKICIRGCNMLQDRADLAQADLDRASTPSVTDSVKLPATRMRENAQKP